MKLKLLLFLLLTSTGVLTAQDTIRSLIISEARMNRQDEAYVELTNMGDEPVDLSQFKFGLMRPWIPEPIFEVWTDPWVPEPDRFYMLPPVSLEPGESWVQTTAYDFGPEQYRLKTPGFEGNQRNKQTEFYELADYLIHVAEPKGDETDSVTTDATYGDNYQWTWETWNGRGCFYIEQHLSETDSIVIDQVGGVFDNEGKNDAAGMYDVAGVEGATGNSILVRKYSIKTGNLDFASAKGVGLEDSEWIPVPFPQSEGGDGYNYRDVFWTVGNHGPYNLDENTLVSDVADIDLAGKTITVPWGTRRGDGIMHLMERKPGIAWEYVLNPNLEDSTTFAARTGDTLNIYVCGDDLDFEKFAVIVEEPTNDINIVVPVADVDPEGDWRDDVASGILDWPRVTQHETGPDTITGNWYGIPFATRVDSLLERLEKPSNAEWQFEWFDGVERADLQDGDKLVVTAENGDEKKYHIQMRPFEPSHNAYLSAITWPDIPEFYKGIFGWVGDTIPAFNSTTYNYRVQVPFDVDGIPALVAKKEELNSKVEVKRAISLSGTPEQRTAEFIVSAEDDSVTNTYQVEMIKEKPIGKVQPYYAEPFLSEFIFWEQWSNSFAEIMNPGNQPLDLSNYMFAMDWITNPADMITSGVTPGGDETVHDVWLRRYDKYVPGYKWVDESTWSISPATLVRDLNVNPIVEPGDVFCMGFIATDGNAFPDSPPDYVWPVPAQLDVQFNNYEGNATYENPWGEEVHSDGSPVRKWSNSNWYMFKILNDSVKLGLKPANDPNDFKLIEVFGMQDGTDWVIGGEVAAMITNYVRKPYIYEGNPEFEGSFGTTPENSEWTWTNRPYWQARNVPWPHDILNVGNDLGQHFMYTPTQYMSTVSSIVYKVSDGYSMDEEIRGPMTSQTVSDFLSGIVKANEGQTLKVVAVEDGNELGMDELLTMNDTLIVMSADSVNITKYRLDVTEDGLSSNAVLTSDRYEIEIIDNPAAVGETEKVADNHIGSGTVSGFEYGTQVKTVLDNIEIPMGAILTVIDDEGAYVPLTMLNFDTMYVAVTVNPNIFFEVIAEDGTTTIVYQLQPQATESSAFVTSDLYSVDQNDLLIEFIPRGTTVSTFLDNVVPNAGASLMLVDKFGLERILGDIAQDDRLIVTSPDETVQTVYYLSMLRTRYILETTYLAYVTSNVYDVDQMEMVISGASGTTDLATFYDRIDPAMGATATVIDADGNEKTSGDLDMGDMLMVVSADGKYEAMYTIDIGTSANLTESKQIMIYPNPTNNKIKITGVEFGGKIRVFNSIGANIKTISIQRNIETISLEDQPAGIYIIDISNLNKSKNKFKVLKK